MVTGKSLFCPPPPASLPLTLPLPLFPPSLSSFLPQTDSSIEYLRKMYQSQKAGGGGGGGRGGSDECGDSDREQEQRGFEGGEEGSIDFPGFEDEGSKKEGEAAAEVTPTQGVDGVGQSIYAWMVSKLEIEEFCETFKVQVPMLIREKERELLVQHGVDLNARNDQGPTILKKTP
jgi:hypothetical protein